MLPAEGQGAGGCGGEKVFCVAVRMSGRKLCAGNRECVGRLVWPECRAPWCERKELEKSRP